MTDTHSARELRQLPCPFKEMDIVTTSYPGARGLGHDARGRMARRRVTAVERNMAYASGWAVTTKSVAGDSLTLDATLYRLAPRGEDARGDA